ncbi:MAG: hypothetical protein IT325_09835 [Anaerolineae bacterium]|nr:hypothetical protein [Anaerolineae bacterium]
MEPLIPIDPPPSRPIMIGGVIMFSNAAHAEMMFTDLGFELVEQTETTLRMVRDGRCFEAYAERTLGNQWRGYVAQLPEPVTTPATFTQEPDHGQEPEEADE